MKDKKQAVPKTERANFDDFRLTDFYALRNDPEQYNALSQMDKSKFDREMEELRKKVADQLRKDLEIPELNARYTMARRDSLRAEYEINELQVAIAQQREEQLKNYQELAKRQAEALANQAQATVTPDNLDVVDAIGSDNDTSTLVDAVGQNDAVATLDNILVDVEGAELPVAQATDGSDEPVAEATEETGEQTTKTADSFPGGYLTTFPE